MPRDPGTLSVGELRTFLQDLPDEMEVWVAGSDMGPDVACGVRRELRRPRRLPRAPGREGLRAEDLRGGGDFMKFWLRTTWRRLRGRCLMCGKRRLRRGPQDLYSAHPNPRWCRWCNKSVLHSSHYGMSGEQFRKVMSR